MPFYRKRRSTRSRRPRTFRRKRTTYKRRSRFPARFRGTSKKRYNFTKRVARAIQTVAENKFLTNRYEDIAPKPFVHLASDGYQASFNLGDAVSDYSAQGMPLSSGLQCLNVLPAQRDGDYIFGKKIVTRIGIYTHSIDLTDDRPSDLAPDAMNLQFNLKVLKINAKYTPNGQQGSNVLSTQCWIDEANKTCGFADARSFSQLDLKFYQVNKRRFNVLRDVNFMLSPPSVSTEQVDEDAPGTANTNATAMGVLANFAKVYPAKKYFSLTTTINKKLYFNPDAVPNSPPTNYNDSIYVLITATAPNDTQTSQLANKWSFDCTNTFIYTDM